MLFVVGGWSGRVAAQDAARPTGDYVLAQLDAARQALAQRTQAHPDTALTAVGQQLAQIGDALRQQLGSSTAQPIEILGDKIKGAALRANAAAQRTQAYLKASAACRGSDAQALATSLALAVDQLAKAAPTDKPVPPVIDAVETPDQQPLFVIHPSSQPLAFVVLGANLLDAQCANPQLSLTDVQGKPTDVQPAITSITPQRIALTLASTASLKPGGYVLHVVPQRKAFLVGCTRQPEAVATLQAASPLQVNIEYTLAATCRGQGLLTLGHGSLPTITRRDATVSQAVNVASCANPDSYTVSATVHFGDGDQTAVGPITQSADASITAGLPGGMTLSWDPNVHMLFVRSGAPVCLGVD
ncbi:hypothetical protein [Rhodanobacter hydrolyticus]|uniref:Uncharacterized protein n=1 Tax=Rhodanobacter hydrolyticus TaxID=2250595 RepID=A0ABW8JEG3_9GAMM